jgi:hypothetical protein
VGFDGKIHCVARSLDDSEIGLLTEYGGVGHLVADSPAGSEENAAHICISWVLDKLAADTGTAPGEVLLVDSARAGFLSDPFHVRTPGLSLFLEGPTHLGDSEPNRRWLSAVGCDDGLFADRPIVSSSLVRGAIGTVRDFYRQLLPEITCSAELMTMHKVVQGAFNKLCHGGKLGFPVTLHANGSQAFFEIWHCDLSIETEPVIKVGGVTPAIIVSAKPNSDLLKALRTVMKL